MKITSHFTYEEMTHTDTGFLNLVNSYEYMANLTRLCMILETLRCMFNDTPIIVNSGYRSAKVNLAVGGARNSFHLRGLAADIRFPSGSEFTLDDLFELCSDLKNGNPCDCDIVEVIKEPTWVHIAVSDLNKRVNSILIGL